MNYTETFTLDNNFGLDETHHLFRYEATDMLEISEVSNIISCTVSADLNSLPKELFQNKYVENYGIVPFVTDLQSFSKAVCSCNTKLVIHFLVKTKKSFVIKKFIHRKAKAFTLFALDLTN